MEFCSRDSGTTVMLASGIVEVKKRRAFLKRSSPPPTPAAANRSRAGGRITTVTITMQSDRLNRRAPSSDRAALRAELCYDSWLHVTG
jgi:hypothetical protein